MDNQFIYYFLSEITGQKRKLDEDVISKRESDTRNITNGSSCNKRVVQDGFSWWTCLSMGMPVENSRPYSIPKQSHS